MGSKKLNLVTMKGQVMQDSLLDCCALGVVMQFFVMWEWLQIAIVILDIEAIDHDLCTTNVQWSSSTSSKIKYPPQKLKLKLMIKLH